MDEMKVMAMVPTYNEAGNIKKLIDDILALGPGFEVLVVDDNSPDKTYQIVEDIANSNKRVHLLLRKERRGRGWAGIEGFSKAIKLGAKLVVEMDGDLSHEPRFILDFLKAGNEYDIVIGSRYVSGGKDEKRSTLRKMISTFARKYLAAILGVKIQDFTSGFRMFKKSALERILPHLTARDPFIVTEVLFYVKRFGLKYAEVPIEFMPRMEGASKLKTSTLFKYLIRVFLLKETLAENGYLAKVGRHEL